MKDNCMYSKYQFDHSLVLNFSYLVEIFYLFVFIDTFPMLVLFVHELILFINMFSSNRNLFEFNSI